jgi:hypothetical protein
MVAAAVVLIVLVAGVAGYFLLLRPGSTTTSSQVSSSSCTPGSSASCPVSAVTLYNAYGLGGIPTDDQTFTNHTIFATGNLTSVVNFQEPQKLFSGNQVMTGVYTHGNDFEYWYWQNSTGLPVESGNQQVLANCLVKGLAPYGNGSSFLFLENCNLLSIKGR